MISLEISLLGFALAIDAAVVTFALGLLHLELPVRTRIRRGLIICCVFGCYQALMLWLGSYVGYLFTYSYFGTFFQFIVALIFFGLGFKFFQESMNHEFKRIEWRVYPILFLGLATSLDALVSGVSFSTLPTADLASLTIGLMTFVICGFFYLLGQFFLNIPAPWLLRFSAVIFFILGSHVFWTHRNLFLRGLL